MSARRRRTGRLKIPFSSIEAMAAGELADSALVKALGGNWSLTRHSALYRCKNGSYTLHLVWHSDEGRTLTSTIRGLQVASG
ncbi:MAG: hypothetical protein INR68_18925 [Methylobacterium mesophilicum]|nr:hypothetical protein [Methylobacterium mesophilicum]